jgi:hypothetical protein
VDVISLLGIRAILHNRLAEWSDAETDVLHVMSLADHERQVDPVITNSLLTNYAFVLRRTHRRREFRHVEARLAAPQYNSTAVVDVSELLPHRK